MDHVRLGRSELVCSVIGLGGGSSGRFGLSKGGTKSDAHKLIRIALDEGISFFDGAGICGGVDELLADALMGDRHRVVLATKVHLGPVPAPLAGSRIANRISQRLAEDYGLVCSGAAVRRRVEATLKSLRTDCVDLLQLHAVTLRQYPTAAAEIVPELARMKDEGKIRAIGITEKFLADPSHAMLCMALDDARVDTVMTGFSIANTSARETVFPRAAMMGAGVIGMFVMRGLLSAVGLPQTRSGSPPDHLDKILDDAGISSLSELAYRFCRHQQGIDVVMTGTGGAEHLRQNVAAAMAPPLPTFVLERLRHLVSADPQAESVHAT